MEIYKIVLTGGPCSGKTKTINELKERLAKLGYYVILVSETATELIRSNILPKDDYEHTLMFQDIILNLQLLKEQKEEQYANFIKTDMPIIILYDRAILDNRAYLSSSDDFDNLLNNYSLSEIKLVDKYDLVIDLISLSSLRKDLYVNDDVRKEDVNLAATLDRKTAEAWMLSDNMKIIKPTDTIEEKINYVYDIIINYIKKNNSKKENNSKIDLRKSDFDYYNSNNSKIMEINEYMLKSSLKKSFDYKIYERNYKNSTSYLLKVLSKNNVGLWQKQIDKDTFLNILKRQLVSGVNSYYSISFIDDDYNLFKINYNQDEGFIKSYSDDHLIPSNIKILK